MVPRLVAALTRARGFGVPRADDFGDAALRMPSELWGRYRDVFTGSAVEVGGELPLGELYRHFPVSLLERVG